MTDGQLILVAGLLMAAGLAAAKVADRVRVPGLLLFLGLGMLVGSEGIGGVEFDDAELTRTLGTIGLVLILFEGGLTAGWPEIRPVLGSAVSLASIGTVATAVIAGVFATWVFDVDLLGGLIIGSAVAASDSAAIFAVLRGSSLRRNAGADARGRVGHERPDRGPPGRGLHRLDSDARLRRRGHGDRARDQAVDRPRRGDPDRHRRPCRLPAARPALSGPLSRRLAGDGGAGLRRRRGGPRLRLPVRLHRCAGSRHRSDPRPRLDDRLPPGHELDGADLALLHPRAPGLSQRPGRHRGRGPGALRGPHLRRAPSGRSDRDRVLAVRHEGAADARLGGSSRRRPHLARDLPGDRRGGIGGADLQRDLLRRRHLDPHPGRDFQPAGGEAWD